MTVRIFFPGISGKKRMIQCCNPKGGKDNEKNSCTAWKVHGFDEFETTEPSIIPGFFSVYKEDRWSGFFAVTIPGGGGKVNFDDGDARTVVLASNIINTANEAGYGVIYTGIESMNLDADSLEVGYTLGGAYEINDMLSVAGGVRYVDAKQTFKGNAVLDKNSLNPAAALFKSTYKVDLKRTATGWSWFVGLDVTPREDLNVGLLYMSNTDLDYESDVSTDDAGITPVIGWADGTKQREDLPGLLGLGVSYMITPRLRVEVNYTLYLENAATWQEQRYKETGNSWDSGVAVEYAITPQWKASLGYMHTAIMGMPPENKLPEAPELDADTLAAGVAFSPTDRLQLNLGALKVFYKSEDTDITSTRSPAGTELAKDVWAIGIGVQYRYF
jgi:long-chain fatty acid transport protein